jgi:hypothetical protein
MIDWTKQHCGVHQASFQDMIKFMPDLTELIETFPENPNDFIWDVKVHMLMPGQYPCIPNWHYDNVPRVNNVQDFNKITPDAPMYLWVSGHPLTEFRANGKTWKIEPKKWIRFTQCDEHRGTMSEQFTWRCFIRATHKIIMPQNKVGESCLRRHSQVYLDASNFKW